MNRLLTRPPARRRRRLAVTYPAGPTGSAGRRRTAQLLGCLDRAPFGLAVVRLPGRRVIGINRRWSKLTGLRALRPRSTVDALAAPLHPDDRAMLDEDLEAAMASREPLERAWRVVRADGALRRLRSLLFASGARGGTRDVAILLFNDAAAFGHAEVQVHAELARVTRVHALGELTASIAHEVNQPLAAISLNAGAALRWMFGRTPDRDEAEAALQRIMLEANRAGEAIRRLRALVPRTAAPPAAIDMNAVVTDAVPLVRRELVRHGIRLTLVLDETLPPVLGARSELAMVVVALILNAAEAVAGMSDRVREVTVRTACDADAVVVDVEDRGIGIAPEDRQRIFDLFYTTKTGGLGLGLAIGRSIAEAYGGRLAVVATDAPVTVVRMTMPRAVQPAA